MRFPALSLLCYTPNDHLHSVFLSHHCAAHFASCTSSPNPACSVAFFLMCFSLTLFCFQPWLFFPNPYVALTLVCCLLSISHVFLIRPHVLHVLSFVYFSPLPPCCCRPRALLFPFTPHAHPLSHTSMLHFVLRFHVKKNIYFLFIYWSKWRRPS